MVGERAGRALVPSQSQASTPNTRTRTHVPVPESLFPMDMLDTKDCLLDCALAPINFHREQRAICSRLHEPARKQRQLHSSGAQFCVSSNAPLSSQFRRAVYLWHAGVDPCAHDTNFPTLEPGRLLKQRRRCVGGRGTTRIAQGTAAPCAHHAKLRQPAMRAGLRVPRVLIARKCRVGPLWGSIDPCLTTAKSHPR